MTPVRVLLLAAIALRASGMDAGAKAVGAGPPLFMEQARLSSSEGGFVTGYGRAVAIYGDTVAIGARSYDSGAGRAYAYTSTSTGWIEQRLTAPDLVANNAFGQSIAVHGDMLVVGAPYNAPAVYVFVRGGGTWALQEKVIPPDGADSGAFGYDVRLAGDILAVGSPTANTPTGVRAGAVYVFARSGTSLTFQQKLTASAALAGDRVGSAVAVSGDTIVAGGVRQFDDLSGSAYVFARSSGVWAEQQQLSVPGAGLRDAFGSAVAVNGDTLMIGAPLRDVPFMNNGAVFVFVRSGTTWTPQPELDHPISNEFGNSVALRGDLAVVGTSGTAHVYVRSAGTWTRLQGLVGSDSTFQDHFGASAAIFDDTILLGATGSWGCCPIPDRPAPTRAQGLEGAGYVFRRAPAPTAYFTLMPCRIADTRTNASPLAANAPRTFPVAGLCGVPADAVAVTVIMTAVNPGEQGDLRLYPTSFAPPVASALNFSAGQTRAGNGILPLGSGGQIDVLCDMPPGSTAGTHFVLDVFGYFR